jgi:hypothetical protein
VAILATEKDVSTVETAKMTADEIVSHEMSICLRKLAKADGEPGERLKTIYDRLATKTGLTYGQVRRIWKRDWKIVPGRVVRRLDQIARRARKKNKCTGRKQQEVLGAPQSIERSGFLFGTHCKR